MSFLDPILNPLLYFGPVWALVIISFIISLIIVIAYKYLTNQTLMKDLKTEIKELQKEMKTLKDKPQEMMKVQKKAMQTNMKYMMHSFKPTLITFIPIILIFGWLHGHMAYYPLNPGEDFEIRAEFAQGTQGEIELRVMPTSEELEQGLFIIDNGEKLKEQTKNIKSDQALFYLKGEKEGTYNLEFEYGGKKIAKELIISSDLGKYAEPQLGVKGSKLEMITVGNEPIKPLFGKVGWLGTYIILSIVFSLILRKLLKVY